MQNKPWLIFHLGVLIIFCVASIMIFILTIRKKNELGWMAGLSAVITGLFGLTLLFWEWNLLVLILGSLFTLLGSTILIVYPKKSFK